MSGNAGLLLWLALVILGIGAMQWGAARASDALDVLRERAGMPGTVAGALLGIATAAPEISVNLASVGFGWPDLGLGAALGSNVPALPLAILLSWLSLRAASRGGVPVVAPAAAAVQAWPYLLVVLLLAVLTLPPGWAGLQPVDAAVLGAAWLLYLGRALLRPRAPAAPRLQRQERPLRLGLALLGLPAVALGALGAVIAARRLGEAFGASDLVIGLFVIGLLCALPESFAAWRLAREGKETLALSAAMGDGVVSLTLALVPPALAGTGVGSLPLYLVNLAYLVFALAAWIGLNHLRRGQVLGPARVAVFLGGYTAYAAAIAWVLPP